MSTTTKKPMKSTSSSSSSKPFEYEFGGPVGAAATTLLLPIVVLLLAHWSHVGAVDWQFAHELLVQVQSNKQSFSSFWNAVIQNNVLCPSCSSDTCFIILGSCALSVIAWFLFQVVLERCLPCELVEGAPIVGSKNNDKRLKYRINGHLAFWVTVLLVTIGWPYYDTASVSGGMIQFSSFPYWSLLYEYFAELAFCTTILCFIVNTFLYLNSFRKDSYGQAKILAAGGNSGNVCYDFFMGRELNPRVGTSTFDWKEFCELRPGLIGWMLLNAASAHQQMQTLGFLSGSMILINVFHGIYIWDALYQEKAILTTMDITTDGFGFMLLFGDLAWVPFTYSLQARYLVHHDPGLSAPALLAIVGVHAVGYAIFRGANGQKDAFRRNPNDPSVAHLEFLQTKRGTKLLTSGWWGLARKINYTGDYIMGLSWCLVCGFDSIVPYYYAIYFMILLVHRSIRDDHMCQQKYGDDWNTYKKLVPYRFIPGVV